MIECSPSFAFHQSGFSKGAGSQLMLRSATQSRWDTLEGAAKHELNEAEQRMLRHYLQQYRQGQITVEDLVQGLRELLNTHAKVRNTLI